MLITRKRTKYYTFCSDFIVRVVQLHGSIIFRIALRPFLAPFYRQNAVDATLGVFRVDGLYLWYCPLARKRSAAAGTVFSR